MKYSRNSRLGWRCLVPPRVPPLAAVKKIGVRLAPQMVFLYFSRSMRVPNMRLGLKLDNVKVVSIADQQTDRQKPPSNTLVYRLAKQPPTAALPSPSRRPTVMKKIGASIADEQTDGRTEPSSRWGQSCASLFRG